MSREMKTLDELFAEEEEKRLAKEKAEIAAEDAAYKALPQEEKDRLDAEREAYWQRIEDAAAESDEDEDEAEEEEDEQ